jgi:LysR family transcriptional activator of mexEF-oprN operon
VVVEEGSVTKAAGRLYLTQPAVSAAIARLARAVGEPLFVREGRTVVPTARGRRVYEAAKPHLAGMIESVTDSAPFDASRTTRTFRLALSDDATTWLLPSLLDLVGREAPAAKVVILPTDFRGVVDVALTPSVDLAISVVDETPKSLAREPLRKGGFVCLFDAVRHPRGKRWTLARYLATPHVIVSYNGDLRGIVEDLLGHERNVVCSTPYFAGIGGLIAGSERIATVPALVAARQLAMHPTLATGKLPFSAEGVPIELVYKKSREHDAASVWLRGVVHRAARPSRLEHRIAADDDPE